jgi:hypothetical protein
MEFPEFGGLSRRDFEGLIEELRTWAATHPKQNEPVIMLMGKSLTPHQFVREVEDQEEFGRSFLDYVRRQSEATDTRPRTFIDRAIMANKPT